MGALGATVLTGCTGVDAIDNRLGEFESGPIREVEWGEDESELVVTFAEEHEADFIAVVHEYDDETVIYSGDAPRFDGPVRIPLLAAVSCDGAQYPTNTFELVVGKGTMMLGMVEEILEREQWEVSEEWLQRAAEYETEYGECYSLGAGEG